MPWSDWITPPPTARPVAITVENKFSGRSARRWSIVGHPDWADPGHNGTDYDFSAEGSGQIADAIAGSGSTYNTLGGHPYGDFRTVDVSTGTANPAFSHLNSRLATSRSRVGADWPSPAGNPAGSYQDDIRQEVIMTQQGVHFQDDPTNPDYRDGFPSALWGLTYGVDYAQIPGTSDYVEYEAGDGEFLGWQYATLGSLFGAQSYHQAGHASGVPTDNRVFVDPSGTPVPWRVMILPDTFTEPTYFFADPALGDEADRWTQSVPNDGTSVANGHTFTLDVSLVAGRTDFWAALSLAWFDASEPPAFFLTDYVPTISGDSDGEEERYQTDVYFTAIVTNDVSAQVTYQYPRYRYWIPEGWHTVGGHFRTVGPAGLRILTPGVGWVPVLDGSV